MAIAFVSSPTGTQSVGAVTSLTCASFDSTGANFMVVVIAASQAITNVTDNKSNGNYLKALGPFSNSTDEVSIYYCENANVGSGHTITVNLTSGFIAFSAASFSGLGTSSVLDKSTNAGGSAGTLDSGATTATSQAEELLVGGGTVSSSATDVGWTAGSGWTIPAGSSVIRALDGAVSFIEYKTVSSIGTYNATATCVTGSNEMLIATFKATAAPGGGGFFRGGSELNGLGVGGPFFQNPLT